MPYRSSADWDRPVLKRQRDPFLTRVGLMIAGIALLIPVALIVRAPADGATRLESESLPGAVALVQPGATAAEVVTDVSVASSDPAADPAAVPTEVATDDAAAVVVAPTAVATIDPIRVEAAAVTTTTIATTTEAPTTVAPTTTQPATTAPAATAPPCGSGYEVEAGDYWSGIAADHDVALRDLLAVNSANVNTAIYPGDDICLPVGASLRTTTTVARTTTTDAPATTAPKPTTTVARTTTTTEAPVPTAPARSYAEAEVIQIIRDVWPDDLEERAIEVARRESTLRPGVRNSCCFGLFQINWNSHRSWLDDWGVTSAAQLYDPVVNAQVAVAVHQRAGGWGPWGG